MLSDLASKIIVNLTNARIGILSDNYETIPCHIKKKSRLESHGEGSGVEIKKNEPYSSGPGGSGQYTYKIYHLGKRIPTWVRSILPNETLQAHEEAWNAYPYTKTKYYCPAFNRVTLEIETKYFDDAGRQSNVFNLSEEELQNRIVDFVDIVNDPVSDYSEEEDPKLYKSVSTGRGPLSKDWIEHCKEKSEPIMCAYKLCRVEFRFWGLQSRVEGWIHSYALRNTMLRAHIQAWVWQDEWYGLSMSDVRQLELEAAEHLSKVMACTDNVDSESSSGIYYDCVDWEEEEEKPSLIRWSSELLVTNNDSPPLTPRCSRSTALLVMLFHGDFPLEVSVDYKPADASTLKMVVEKQVVTHYPQLSSRVRFLSVPCGSELHSTISQLTAMCPSFGIFHPSLALLLSSTQVFQEAVLSTVCRANRVYSEFSQTEPGKSFQGEVFVVGDHVGGLLLYEALKKCRSHPSVSRHSSSLSTSSHPIPEDREYEASWSVFEFPIHEAPEPVCCRNLSAPPLSSRALRTSCGFEHELTSSLDFRPSTAFFLGCPLALVLAQRKLFGNEIEKLDCGQIFNLYYALDPCGARLEPLLNSRLALLPPMNVPRYIRYPLGDGQQIHFDNATDTSLVWGVKRIDQALHCPHGMVALPSTALPNILHASYWESDDVAAFILRQFIRSEEIPHLLTLANMSTIPSEIEMPMMSWSRKRTKFKVKNLAPNHRGNDVILVEGAEQQFVARFCYGPMDLVTLSREKVSAFVCPVGGDWHLISTESTDSHGRVTFSLGSKLPVGVHGVKMIVHGDHSFLDLFVAIVPKGTKVVIFSVDGSLTGSVSVTGRDPRVRPGAVDVVRYWHDLGYLITYVTARPDMQQRVVSSWLSLHNFPHGLLIFTPSFSREPLKQKMLHIKCLIESGITIQAAYGSNKDISVYSCAGICQERIMSVSSNKRKGCRHVDNYSTHLIDLSNGVIEFAQPADTMLVFHHNVSFTLNNQRNLVQRTHSFTPRSGRYDGNIKEKKAAPN